MIILIPLSSTAHADNEPFVDVDKILSALDFSQLDYLMSVHYEDFSTKELITELITNGYDIATIFKIINFRSIATAMIKTIVNTVIVFMLFSFIAMVSKQLTSSNSLSNMNNVLIIMMLIGSIIPILVSSIRACADCYGQIKQTSSVVVPILTVLLAAAGGIGTSSLVEAFMVIVNDNLVNFMQFVIIPLITSGMVLYIVSPFMKSTWTKKGADLISSIVKYLLGVIMTICGMLFSLRTLSIATVDGAMMRTAKYAIDDMIPIVGGAISDIASVLAGGFVIVKNAVGVIAVLVMVATSLGPILLLFTHVFTFKIASFMCAVLGEKEISDVAENLSKSIVLYLATCISILTCMFIIIMLCIVAGNKILMMR